jgi:hypothetical protein
VYHGGDRECGQSRLLLVAVFVTEVISLVMDDVVITLLLLSTKKAKILAPFNFLT